MRCFIYISLCASIFEPSVKGIDVHANPNEITTLLREQDDWFKENSNSRETKCKEKLRNSFESSFVPHDPDATAAHPISVLMLYNFWSQRSESFKKCGAHFVASFPTEDDVEGVAFSIIHLQSVYNLTTRSLAAGEVRGHRSKRPLNKAECVLVANAALNRLMRPLYEEWHKECMTRITFEEEMEARNENFEKKLELLDQSLADLKSGGLANTSSLNSLPADVLKSVIDSNSSDVWSSTFQMYRKLCQMRQPEFSVLPPEEKCLLYETGSAFDKLSPLKVEFLAYDPLVAVVHDVLDDGLISEVSEAVKSEFESPKSVSSSSGQIQKSSGRTGKVAFQPYVSERVQKLSGRISGLSTEHSEALQVVSYGIGGHYEPHIDFFRVTDASENTFKSDRGDRIATLIYYFNDVLEGGSTVFPRLGLSVAPRKGSALFWYNLYRNGSGDPDTLHSGCPVLVGRKTIANMWFREAGQEGRRPCSIDKTV